MRVVLDSNAIVRDYRLSGAMIQSLVALLDPDEDRLCVPKVSLDETKVHAAKAVQAFSANVDRGSREISRILGTKVDSPFDQSYVTQTIRSYNDFLNRRISELGISIIDYPELPHAELAERAFWRKAPFDAEGRGYQDTLIWQSVVDLALETNDLVVLVTNDKDFRLGDDLHPDLAADLTRLGIPRERIVLVKQASEIAEQFAELRKRDLDQLLRAEIIDGFKKGQFRRTDIHEALGMAVQDKLQYRELDPISVDLPGEFESPMIESVQDISDVEITTISALDDEGIKLLISLTFNAECEIWGVMFKPDTYIRDDDDIRILTFDYNRTHSEMTATRSLLIYADAVFAPEDASINLDINDYEVIVSGY